MYRASATVLGIALSLGCARGAPTAPAVPPAASTKLSATMTPTASVSLAAPPPPLVAHGPSVRDLNGDKIADVAVAAAPDTVFFYWGGPQGLPSEPSVSMRMSSPDGPFGTDIDIATPGDLDGDGIGDLVVLGRTEKRLIFRGDDEPSEIPGRSQIAVVRGGPRLGVDHPVQTFVPRSLAEGIAAAGDVNGDGLGDVLVKVERGFEVYHGGRGGLGKAPAARVAEAIDAGRLLALSVAGVGDLNHDGFGDVAVGAYVIPGEPGLVYIYLGAATGLARRPAMTLIGPDEPSDPSRSAACTPPDSSTKGAPWHNDFFGTEVAGPGDVDGDGFDDLLVGADGYGVGAGRAYVYRGVSGGVALAPAATFDDPQGSCHAARVTVAAAGDVNRDGFADFLFGAESHADNIANANLILGSASGPEPTLRLVSNIGPWNFAATAGGLQGAGDLDGDGYPDVVIGTYLKEPRIYDIEAPRLLMLFGSASGLGASRPIALPHGTRGIAGRN